MQFLRQACICDYSYIEQLQAGVLVHLRVSNDKLDLYKYYFLDISIFYCLA